MSDNLNTAFSKFTISQSSIASQNAINKNYEWLTLVVIYWLPKMMVIYVPNLIEGTCLLNAMQIRIQAQDIVLK